MATAVVEVFFYTISLSINAVKTAGKERAMYNREIQEAIDAGECALRSLKEARESLESARGWGLLDMFGGGTISGLVKHMKVTDARNSLDKAKADLERFRVELADVQDIQGLDVQIGVFRRSLPVLKTCTRTTFQTWICRGTFTNTCSESCPRLVRMDSSVRRGILSG